MNKPWWLVIDGNEENAEHARAAISGLGYDVSHCKGAQTALQLLKGGKVPDGILLGYEWEGGLMPGEKQPSFKLEQFLEQFHEVQGGEKVRLVMTVPYFHAGGVADIIKREYPRIHVYLARHRDGKETEPDLWRSEIGAACFLG